MHRLLAATFFAALAIALAGLGARSVLARRRPAVPAE